MSYDVLIAPSDNKSSTEHKSTMTNKISIKPLSDQKQVLPEVRQNKEEKLLMAQEMDDTAIIEKAIKEVIDILDKITPLNYDEISTEIIETFHWKYENLVNVVAEYIFDKAVNKPSRVGIYADLCHSLYNTEQLLVGCSSKCSFVSEIIRKLQRIFEGIASTEYPQSILKLQEQIAEEQIKSEKDEQKLADLNKQLEETNAKEKQQMLGIISFASHLYRCGFLNFKIVENCIVILIRNAEGKNDELMLEYAITFIKEVGLYVNQKSENVAVKLNSYVGYLDKFKNTVSNRIQHMITDLMEFRERKWHKKDNSFEMIDEIKKYSEKDVNESQHSTTGLLADKKDGRTATEVATICALEKTMERKYSIVKENRLGSTRKWGVPVNANSSSPKNKEPQKVVTRQVADSKKSEKIDKSNVIPTNMDAHFA